MVFRYCSRAGGIIVAWWEGHSLVEFHCCKACFHTFFEASFSCLGFDRFFRACRRELENDLGTQPMCKYNWFSTRFCVYCKCRYCMQFIPSLVLPCPWISLRLELILSSGCSARSLRVLNMKESWWYKGHCKVLPTSPFEHLYPATSRHSVLSVLTNVGLVQSMISKYRFLAG